MTHGTTRTAFVAGLLITFSIGALADEPPAQATPFRLPDDRLGIRTAPILLLSRDDVRADLGLTEQQSAAAVGAIADLHARAARLRELTGDEAVTARRAVDEAQGTWIQTNLTPEQRDRLVQIDLQWEGPTALVTRPIVRSSLGLTAEQQGEIRRLVVRRDAARTDPAARATAEADLARGALTALDDEQKTRWKSMLGRPFAPRVAAAPATDGTARR